MSIQTKSYKSKKTNKTTTKFYAVVFNPATGAAKWSKGFATRAEAKSEELRMIDMVKEPDLFNATFGEVAKSWVKSSEGVLANSTFEGYKWYLKKYVNPVFENERIDAITPVRLQTFINRMCLKYSAETTNKVISLLSNVFSHAAALQIIPENTAACLKRRKPIKHDLDTWSTEQIKAFLDYDRVKESDYYEMFLLIFSTGMRPSEVCGIQRNSLKGDLLLLTKGYDRYGVLTDMKTGGSHRSIKLPGWIADKLNRLPDKNNTGFLFVNCLGNPVNPNAFSKAFKRILRSYNEEIGGLPDVSLYTAARHSFGTNLIVDAEVPVSIVSSIMGNSERVLQERYVHVKNEIKYESINNYLEAIV